jgi:hypothetical protein
MEEQRQPSAAVLLAPHRECRTAIARAARQQADLRGDAMMIGRCLGVRRAARPPDAEQVVTFGYGP